MSKKIPDFFTSIPKKRKIDDEEAGGSAKKIKFDKSKIQDCKVVLVDIMRDTKPVNSTEMTATKCPKENNSTSKGKKHVPELKDENKKGYKEPASECKVCGKAFKSRGGMYNHIKFVHRSHGKKFECDFCGKKFSSKGIIDFHMSVHLPTVECPICHAEMKKASLRAHLRNYHTGKNNFPCSICPATFKTKPILKQHEKIHNKKFECDVCDKKYKLQCHLNNHKREAHDNPGSFACDKCDKRCNSKGELKSHQKVHDRFRSKRFKCRICSYSADNKSHFENHQKVHQRQEEKFADIKDSLKCEQCGKLSRDKRTLKQHMIVVHPLEKFQCDLCGNYKKTKSDLKHHINRHMLIMSK